MPHGDGPLENYGLCPTQHIVTKDIYTINNSLPIDLVFEKSCLKFIFSCTNSNNTIVKSVSSSAIMYSYSTLGENYRFLSDKYDIWPTYWTKSFSIVLRKFYDYVDNWRFVYQTRFW